jgi:hypothetical protein
MSDLSVPELEAEIASWAACLTAGTCRWLELVGELDARGCYESAEWLAWRCALSPRSAREHVRVARRIRELPLIHAAFASGELSYAKVRALTRVATVESEAELLELARHATAAQLDLMVQTYRRVTNEEMNELEDGQYLGWTWDEQGFLLVRARLAPEEGALLLKAIEATRDRLWHRPDRTCRGSAEPPRQPSTIEALAAIAEQTLAETDGAGARGSPFQVVVHVDETALDNGDGAVVVENGPAVAPESARRLACDAALAGGGRRRRTVTRSLRQALQLRDRGCRYPGCRNRLYTHAHHVQHWINGGATTLDNLVLLCSKHHRRVHEGGETVEPDQDGSLVFRDRWGEPIPAVPKPPPADPERLLAYGASASIDEWTCASGDNDPLDLNLAVDALLAICRR